MDQITIGLPDIITIHDDKCIYSRNTGEHNQHLLQLIKTASQKGLVFNSNKFSICQPQISFYGTIFTVHCPRHEVQTHKSANPPQHGQPCKSSKSPVILVLINYLQPFLPSLASKMTFLFEQVAQWDWDPSTYQAFYDLESWICNSLFRISLAYCDHCHSLVLQANASEYSLSTAFLQNNQPIAFTNMTLMDVENIERECLSICFGLENFTLTYMDAT